MLKTIATFKEEVVPESKLGKLVKEADFQKTREFLRRRDLLVYEEGAYRFRACLLRKWVAQQ